MQPLYKGFHCHGNDMVGYEGGVNKQAQTPVEPCAVRETLYSTVNEVT